MEITGCKVTKKSQKPIIFLKKITKNLKFFSFAIV